jgi:hypothetical protein
MCRNQGHGMYGKASTMDDGAMTGKSWMGGRPMAYPFPDNIYKLFVEVGQISNVGVVRVQS